MRGAVEANGGDLIILNTKQALSVQQEQIKSLALKADVIITSARRRGERAPLLLPTSTLDSMQSGSVIIDLALSEGGNVEGSEHDKILELGNGITVANTSGYPKVVPEKASQVWSKASYLFLIALLESNHPCTQSCLLV